MKEILVQKDSYYDSVFLMLINQDVKQIPGIKDAVVAMGTEMNVDLLKDMGLTNGEVESAGANDLIIALEGEDQKILQEAIETAKEMLSKKSSSGDGEMYRPASLRAAIEHDPDANIVIVSVPGEYAAREVRKALQNDLHVMLFSDNVALEDEIALKKLAAEKGLLMMGPDCGTAIINGKPLCFANVVRRGRIGVVAASGTGLQEVSCAIENLGEGVSQAIGTGGRDLKSEQVGGIMMLMGIEALKNEQSTKVITVVSKPPHKSVAGKVIDALKKSGKPCVVHFIGLEKRPAEGNVHYAGNLEEAAGMSVALALGKKYEETTFTIPESDVERIVEFESKAVAKEQKYLRGMYTGGTLADEAVILLSETLGGVYSFDAADDQFALKDPHVSQKHTVVDLGEDVFTVGRPHPMIDPSIRTERIEKEAEDKEVALFLFDCVLGYGSHSDPAGAMVPAITAAKQAAKARGGYLPVITSITGTDGDIQRKAEQKRKLEAAGVVVMPRNYQASILALKIMEKVAR